MVPAMLHPDVVDLRAFYDTQMGHVVRRVIRRRLRGLWPDATGQRVLGIGYPIPYLRPFLGEAERVVAMMPAHQGVVHWPQDGSNLVALTDDDELPLPDGSFDRIVLVHGLETSEHVRHLLGEVWRVMAANGRLLVITPNRRGVWARFERTPFGHGHPYSQPQLNRLLKEQHFSPTVATGSLFFPPTRWRHLVRAPGAWERIGARLWPGFAGALLVEAGKQIYAVRAERERRVLRRKPVILPAGATPREPLAAPVIDINGFSRRSAACGGGNR